MKHLNSIILFVGTLIFFSACSPVISTVPNYDVTRLSPEIEAFEAFDKTARYRPDAVLFTGSSSIRFWPSLGADMDPIPVLNRGFGGSTLPEVNHYYDRIITKFRPSIVVLYCGENDIWMDRTVDDVILDYKAFVKKTKEVLPQTKIIFLSLKPSPARWGKWVSYQEANRKIKVITDKDKDQYFVDISKYMLNDQGQPIKSIFIYDMLHMNEKGYEGWRNIVSPIVQDLYGQEKGQ